MTTTDDTLARARERLAALRAAEGAATAGPWYDMGHNAYAVDPTKHAPPPLRPSAIAGAGNPPDAAAIVALRNAAPVLLDLADAVARLAAERAEHLHWGWTVDDDVMAAIDAALARLAGEA